MIPPQAIATVLEVAGTASNIQSIVPVQTLWSGYGEIARVNLVESNFSSLIVKWVKPPVNANHPRGWGTDQSHLRKLRSYQVESQWYTKFSDRLGEDCRVARCYQATSQGDEHLFVLEDLDAVGFAKRHTCLSENGVQTVLTWLAQFHATFLSEAPTGLWPVGTYWHLATRPDELAAIDDSHPLRRWADPIDRVLSHCPIQTFVHGDAKVANFCFSSDGDRVAAVDFQYVGGGCGMKDVAYFLGSCLSEDQCEHNSEKHLDFYFAELNKELRCKNQLETTIAQVEATWRPLYPIAWADFHRFLLGWCPGHQKLHGYTKRMTKEAIETLKNK